MYCTFVWGVQEEGSSPGRAKQKNKKTEDIPRRGDDRLPHINFLPLTPNPPKCVWTGLFFKSEPHNIFEWQQQRFSSSCLL